MNKEAISKFINGLWDESILPTLQKYIYIPNKSPAFDSDWQKHGYMDQAVTLIKDWCQAQNIEKMHIEVVRLPGRTPLIFMDIPGNNKETVLLYGHLDKQPEMVGWDADLSPWVPKIKGDKLYGRGAADDGYAAFASLAAIKALQVQKIPHARCVVMIEACEESGSYDLPFYIDALEERIGKPSLVICLDSGCGNYEQLWVTTSLRGLLDGFLHIEVLKQGIHSGMASGIVPSCFRILRQLLSRIENKETGEVVSREFHSKIPEGRVKQVEHAVGILGETVHTKLPFSGKTRPQSDILSELLLNQTWRPALSITGLTGMPLIENAGNVTLPELTIKLSMRTPPTADAQLIGQRLKEMLEKDPPYDAHVRFTINSAASGWNAPAESPWLVKALDEASHHYFGKEAVYLGEGASIPFMGMLGKKFPQAQFVITGLLGPESNAHGPNEFLHIPTGKKLTCCIAETIAQHFVHAG